MSILSKISVGIWRRNEFANDALDVRLAGITAYHVTRTMGIRYTQIHHSHFIENILLSCQTDWCLIQSPGHVFGSKNVQLARSSLLRMTERDDVAAFGHLLDDKSYFGLHHQAVLINVKLWRDNGRPVFGATSVGEQMVRPIRRSEENVHDDYTPLWLGPKVGPSIRVEVKTVGWSFISHLSGLGYWFLNFRPDFRNKKFFCYPLKSNAPEMLEALRDVSKDVPLPDPRLASIVKRVRAFRPAGIHVINNEGYEDIPPNSADHVGLAIFVASGFKGNVILHRLGFDADTEVIFYDIDEATLEFKRQLIKDWDGRNFMEYAENLIQGMADQYETGIFTDVDLKTSYQKMIDDVFGSEEKWLSHWEKFKNLRFSFVKADILRGQQPLISALPDTPRAGRQVIWTSNIFNYGIEIIGMSFDERSKAYNSLIQGVRDVTGRDPVFVGQTPRDYAEGIWV